MDPLKPETTSNLMDAIRNQPLFGPATVATARPKEEVSQRIALSAGRALPKLTIGSQFLKADLPTFASSTEPIVDQPGTFIVTPKQTGPSPTSPGQYQGLIQAKSKQYGVPVSILTALLGHESGYNPKAKNINSKETSYGLGQINLKAHPNVTRAQAENPDFAVNFAAEKLAGMIQKYGLYEGIQAYNTPGAIGSAQLIQYANRILKNAGYGVPASSPRTLKGLKAIPKKRGTGGPGTDLGLPKTLTSLGKKTTDYGGKTRYEGMHPGVDFANARGTPIPSVVSGTVTGVDPGHAPGENNFGNRVEITDGAGMKHMYSHLDKIATAVGQKVNPGQVVATMGDTGSAYSPTGGDASHLDYRIVNHYNKYVNPHQYFNANQPK